jgi:hypothetical protein
MYNRTLRHTLGVCFPPSLIHTVQTVSFQQGTDEIYEINKAERELQVSRTELQYRYYSTYSEYLTVVL